MRFWTITFAGLIVYSLGWALVLEPSGFDKSLYLLICLVLAFMWMRVYWRIGWGRWVYPMEYLWIPYYIICAYFLVQWLA